MPERPPSWVRLESERLSAQIDPHGAQLSVLRDAEGRDLLWDGDPKIWAGRAPILFPIVGALAGGSYRLGADSYKLPRHGFARGSLFTPESVTMTGASFVLHAAAQSLPVYPFRFALTVSFALRGATLTVTTTVHNRGESPMPASVGYHPGFRWPLPYGRQRAAHFLEFEADEPAPVRRIDAAGLLMPEPRHTPVVQRRLMLEDDLFKDDVVIFDQLRSRSLSYGAADGPRIELVFPDAPYLGVWTKPGAPFICIEPWHGVTDPVDFAGDFTAKPGVFSLAAGDSLATTMAITLLGA